VEAILGKPSASNNREMQYSFEVRERMTSEEIKRARQQNPNASEQDFKYFIGVSIEARFVDSKLNYLAVSRTVSD